MKNTLRTLILVLTVIMTIFISDHNYLDTAENESEYPKVIENTNI